MKTKNFLLSIVSILTLCCITNTFAVNIDSQIEEELNKKTQQEMVKKAQDLNEKITFTKVNSCESMEKVMGDFLETYKKLHPKRTTRNVDYFGRATQDIAYNSISKSADTVNLAVAETAVAGTQSL